MAYVLQQCEVFSKLLSYGQDPEVWWYFEVNDDFVNKTLVTVPASLPEVGHA